MEPTCRYKFLVVDDHHLLEVSNLQRRCNQAVKHPEPVFKLDAPWDTEKMEMFNYNNVLYDPEEKLFKMWYVVCGQRADEYWERGRRTAYATSADGIHWERPILNRVEINGSTENNYLIDEMLSLTYTIIDDPSDLPSRRYKMIFQVESEEARWAKYHMPLNIAWSADGLDWERPVHVNPVLRGISDGGWGFLYDPDRRVYQLYTRRVPNLPRDISLYESFDLVNWEDRGRILVPGDELDPPELFNFQAMAPFFYEDFCLGLLNTQYSLPASESYEVFHEPPADYPSDRLGHVDVQLAYSRDGMNWSRPDDRSPILSIGEPGSPDEGVIFIPAANPFTIDGETYIYYTAVRYQHNDRTQAAYMKEHDYDMRNASSCMLAKMPEDHWVSLDAGSEEGFLVCKPWGPPHEIFVNADAEGGSVEAELVTPYGEVVPEYSRSDCIPVTGNGAGQPLAWKHGKSAWNEIAGDHRGGLLLKIYMRNAKLYSYTLTLPDPEGQLQRDKDNARWCEQIKHRSDNWDGKSNEPAIGVPARQL
jgi:hypothetical protein